MIEKLIYTRLIKFFEKHKIIYANQYGFHSKISTLYAMLDVVTASYENINKNRFTGLAFVNLKKAFDIISHSTFLFKLKRYGISDVVLDLISSNLINRKQKVSVN